MKVEKIQNGVKWRNGSVDGENAKDKSKKVKVENVRGKSMLGTKRTNSLQKFERKLI